MNCSDSNNLSENNGTINMRYILEWYFEEAGFKYDQRERIERNKQLEDKIIHSRKSGKNPE